VRVIKTSAPNYLLHLPADQTTFGLSWCLHGFVCLSWGKGVGYLRGVLPGWCRKGVFGGVAQSQQIMHLHTHTHGGRQLRRYLSYVRVCAKESAAPLCNAPAPLELYSFFRPSRTRHLQLATLCQDSVLSARLTSSYSIWARCRVNLARNIWQDDAMPQPLRPFAPLTMHRKKILHVS